MKKHIFTAPLAALLLSAAVCFTGCGDTASDQADTTAAADSTDTADNDSAGAESETSSANTSDADSAGSVFSNLNTTDLDGNTVDASIFRQNNLTLVNAWNVGCTPCVQELPALQQIHDEYAEKGVAIVGLYFNFAQELAEDELAEISEVLANADATYTQLRLSKEMYETDTMQQVFAFPSTFVVDSSGTIVDKIVGANSYEGWKTAVDDYLANIFCEIENE